MAERRDTKNRLLNRGEYQKADGRYMYRYVDFSGTTRFVYSWCLTQTDRTPKGKRNGKCLRELEKEIIKDLQDKIDSYQANKTTLNTLFEKWIEQKPELKSSTVTFYTYLYHKYIWDTIGRKKISDIKYTDIKKYYNHLIFDLEFKSNSVKQIYTVMHPLFTIAVRDGYIRVNPTDGIISEINKNYHDKSLKRHALTISEQNAFIEFTKNRKKYNYWLPIFTFLLGTGCRIGECLGLTWDDCDFNNNTININHSLNYKPNNKVNKRVVYISTPKTSTSKRIIPMLTDVKKSLLFEYERQKIKGGNFDTIDSYSNFVFCNKQHHVVLPQLINSTIKLIVNDYNTQENKLALAQNREPLLLPHFTAHILRHTFCTRMCENESNIKIIQEIMGHSAITTTMDIYNEATLDKKQESFNNLEGKFSIF